MAWPNPNQPRQPPVFRRTKQCVCSTEGKSLVEHGSRFETKVVTVTVSSLHADLYCRHVSRNQATFVDPALRETWPHVPPLSALPAVAPPTLIPQKRRERVRCYNSCAPGQHHLRTLEKVCSLIPAAHQPHAQTLRTKSANQPTNQPATDFWLLRRGPVVRGWLRKRSARCGRRDGRREGRTRKKNASNILLILGVLRVCHRRLYRYTSTRSRSLSRNLASVRSPSSRVGVRRNNLTHIEPQRIDPQRTATQRTERRAAAIQNVPLFRPRK